jgi:hypothetical protein
MAIVVIVVGTLVVVLGVAVAYDLRARRDRALSADFGEAGRVTSRRAAHDRKASEARNRPSQISGPPSGQGGPSLGP